MVSDIVKLLRWVGRKAPHRGMVVEVPNGTTFRHEGASPMTVTFIVQEEKHAEV